MRPKILVVGDGLIGLTMICALADAPVDLTWVGPKLYQGQLPPDHRSIVLNSTTCQSLDQWGLMPFIAEDLTPIHQVEVFAASSSAHCVFSANETNWPALGYVIPAGRLISALRKKASEVATKTVQGSVEKLESVHEAAVEIKTATGTHHWQGDLILSAEGAKSCLREQQQLEVKKKVYQQVALTGVLDCVGQAELTAVEYFSKEGSIAFLPRGNKQYGFVWIVPEREASMRLAQENDAFLSSLAQAFGTRLGMFKNLSKLSSYPLTLHWMPQRVARQVIYFGNAAQSVHPVMGQGYNLGVRDIAVWLNFSKAQGFAGCANYSHNLQYARLRETDRKRVIHASDYLATSSDTGRFFSRGLRQLGLVGLKHSAMLRRSFIQASLGESVPWVLSVD